MSGVNRTKNYHPQFVALVTLEDVLKTWFVLKTIRQMSLFAEEFISKLLSKINFS